MADTTVYGRIHASIDSVTGATGQAESLFVNSSSSRFGVKGSEDLGDGLKALYQLETGVQAVGGTSGDGNGQAPTGTLFSGQRDTFIGVAGGFGTFLAGRLPADNQYVYDSNLFADQIGDAGNFISTNGVGAGRANGALHYVSPDMSGFNVALTYLPGTAVAATALANANTAATHGKNTYGIKLNYAAAGVTASLTYFDVKFVTGTTTTNDRKPLSVAGSYDFGNGMVTAQYYKAKRDNTAGAVNSQTFYNLGGKFNVSGNSAIKAQYSHAGDDSIVAGEQGAKMFAIGYDYNFSKRTGMYVAYASVSNDANATFRVDNYGHSGTSTAPTAGNDPHGLSVGLTHNF
ncbi:MAG: hypothetical protein A2Z95_04425 [Gallionellales bacterium GWA2_60_18]|nr:MAG: hypothetical protein A2Z95_04425 [Gallionellales bacterium GWA2_60_18]